MPDFIPSSAGQIGQVALQDLRLDPENPRIPESQRGNPTRELAILLEMGFDAFPVAQSISELGFFNAEPLIIIPSEQEAGAWVVVEGNRRLTALLGLADPSVRASFATPERWEKLAGNRAFGLDMMIPVVKHQSRASTHAEVARVHVVGKLPWRPFMQAKYIAARVGEGRTLQEVADLIGIPKSKAADLYRDQAILNQASELGLETSQVEAAFSLLTVAMGSTKIRNHVGAPLGSRTEVGVSPIPEEKTGELEEMIHWVFGDEEHEAVVSDSRQIPQLGNVIASDVGLSSLRQGKTLEEAKQIIQSTGMDPLDALTKRLTAGRNALSAAASDLAEFAMDKSVRGLVADLESLVEGMSTTIEEVRYGQAAHSDE